MDPRIFSTWGSLSKHPFCKHIPIQKSDLLAPMLKPDAEFAALDKSIHEFRALARSKTRITRSATDRGVVGAQALRVSDSDGGFGRGSEGANRRGQTQSGVLPRNILALPNAKAIANEGSDRADPCCL